MVKLKCWRKLDKNSYRNEGRNENLEVVKLRGNVFDVVVSPFDDIEGSFDDEVLNKNTFKKKIKATKFAKSYMRKHDKC